MAGKSSPNGRKIKAVLRAPTSSPEELDEVLQLLLFRSLPTFAASSLRKRDWLAAASASTLADLCRLSYEMEYGHSEADQLEDLIDVLARRGHPRLTPSESILHIKHVRWTIFNRNLVEGLDDAVGFGLQDTYEVDLAVLETMVRSARYVEAAPLFRKWSEELYHSSYYYLLLSHALAAVGQRTDSASCLARALRVEPALRPLWSGAPRAVAQPPSLLDYASDFLAGNES